MEKRKRRPRDTFKRFTVRHRSRQDADTEQSAEQQACGGAGINLARNGFFRLRGNDASFEKPLDVAELQGNHGTAFGMMRRDLQGRVH
jgi:hypothetical protein